MAEVKRSTVVAPAPPPKIVVVKPKSESFVLPTKPTVPSYDINHHHSLITGEPGTGKTSLGTQEPGVFNLSFDPINKSYEIIQKFVREWRQLKKWLETLEASAEADTFPYTRVQIDGMGTGAIACQFKVCQDMGILHPSEEGFSRGYDAVFAEWSDVIDRFMALPCGVWFIAHQKEKEVETKDGRKFDRISPAIKGQMETILVGKCQLVLNISYIPGGGKSRLATIRGDESVVAKCNINNRFLTVDGRQVEEIVLGNMGPGPAWEKFMRAFNNKQPWANYAEMQDMIAKQKARNKAKAAVTAPPVADE